MCCASEIRVLQSELTSDARLDPFATFPREISLKILGFTDAITLGRAAQVSCRWRDLADDDLLWRTMCAQHIERKCRKCGWGLPLLSEKKRRRPPLSPNPSHQPAALPPQPGTTQPPAPYLSPPTQPPVSSLEVPGGLKRTITAAANAAALGKRSRTYDEPEPEPEAPLTVKRARSCEAAADGDAVPGCGNVPVPGPAGLAPLPVLARPWKQVYCERLAIERNWRQGRHTVQALRGHSDGIMCLQYSDALGAGPGPIVVTGSYDRTARVWDVDTGAALQVLRGHTRGVRCLQFDAVKLITGSMDRTLKIWNWRTGALIRTLQGHTAGIVSLHFNDDLLVSGSADAEIRVWNFRSGECYTLRGHKDWVNAVRLWSPPKAEPSDHGESEMQDEPLFLFSASDDTTIKLWDLRTRECLFTYQGHVTQVQSLKLTSMAPSTLLALGEKQLPQMGSVAREPARGRSPTASALATGSSRAKTHSKDRADDAPRSLCGYNPPPPPGPPGQGLAPPFLGLCSAGAQSHDFVPLVPGDEGVADPESSKPRPTARSRLRKEVNQLHDTLSEAGLASPLPSDGSLPAFYYALYGQADELCALGEHEPEEPRTGEECVPDRPVLVTGSLDNTVKIFDVLTGVCVRTIFGHVEGVWGVDADKLRIVSASHDRTVKVWDRDSGACQSTLVGHTAAVTAVALSDDKIVSGSDDATVRIWSFSPPPVAVAAAA